MTRKKAIKDAWSGWEKFTRFLSISSAVAFVLTAIVIIIIT